jgi:hypothetical protein
MYGPANVTIGQAEAAMLKYIDYLKNCEAFNNRITATP